MSKDYKNAVAPVDLRESIKALRVYAGGYYVRRDEVLAAIESPPAEPVVGPTEVEWMMACNEVGGPDVAEEIITRAYSIAELPRSTPAAPGNDSTVSISRDMAKGIKYLLDELNPEYRRISMAIPPYRKADKSPLIGEMVKALKAALGEVDR